MGFGFHAYGTCVERSRCFSIARVWMLYWGIERKMGDCSRDGGRGDGSGAVVEKP